MVTGPLGPLRRSVREVGLALITAGVIVLLFVAYQLWGTTFTERQHQSDLAKQFHTAVVAKAPAPTPTPTTTPSATSKPVTDVLPSVPEGGAIDHLVIPAIGVDKYVVEGTNEDDLREGPGHYPGTAYPGQVGNTAIAGHRTTYGAPFFDLNEMKTGDEIRITDLNDHTWVYVVDQAPVVVDPGDVTVLAPTKFAQLTLTTCNPRFEATTRLIVFARLQGKAGSVTSPATVTALPKSIPGDGPVLASDENLGHGESGAVGPAAMYGILVVVLWAVTRLAINRTRRGWRLLAYLVGIGICAIPLWFCFENIVLLLPQSI